jgi:preprotein translocase subunit SecD
VARGTSRAWFIIPAVLALLLIWTIVSALSNKGPSSSYEGRGAAVVTLSAPEGGARDAAPKLLERLVALGVDAQVVEAEEDRIRIALRRVADPSEAIAAATTPEPLSFYVVDEGVQQPQDVPDAASAAPAPERLHPWLAATSRADLRAKVERAGVPEGLSPLVECIPAPQRKAPPLCAAWLGRPTPLRAADIREIHLGADRRTEEPLVAITFSEEGARAFEEISRAAAGKMLVVSALGEVQARPRIHGPGDLMQGGRWTFSTRTGDTDRPVAIERAQRIAAAAKLPRLPRLEIKALEEARAPR